MSLHWPKPGPNFVAEYQSAGHVYVHTGSSAAVNLKFLAKSITPIATAEIQFFDSGSHTYALSSIPAGTRFEGKFIKFKCDVDAVLEVTNIPAGSYLHPLTASMKF
jgi:hypothetical protein